MGTLEWWHYELELALGYNFGGFSSFGMVKNLLVNAVIASADPNRVNSGYSAYVVYMA